ncbi:MAG: aminopeptidase P family protein [Spirochaetaceae bacterium]|nr:aminopeptidase P family protein [Spirochaetaceae bacterium]
MTKKYEKYCKERREQLIHIMQEKHIAATVFEDTEGRRDTSIRYLTGHPGDAILIITAKGESILCPWDEHMAANMASVDKILPFTRFSRNPINAVKAILQKLHINDGSRIDISPEIPYPMFLRYVDALPGLNVLCREDGIHSAVIKLRATKDEYEIQCIKEAAIVTDMIVDKLEEGIRQGTIQTETDVALLIEKEARIAGCEGTGFESLVACPERSFGIHCFPPYTAKPFPGNGLSIVDFGVKKEGYTSDVTITFVSGNITEEQEKQLQLIQKAYDEGLKYYNPLVPVKLAATKVNDLFTKAKKTMPHSLGHGVGLEAHEYPVIRSSVSSEDIFLPGMVVTLEPGLYDPELGGCRLENDILITETGNQVLTKSRIIRI